MNKDVYNNLNLARQKLFDLQTSYLGKEFKGDLDVVAMAVDEGLDELDRLGKRIKELKGERK